MPQRAWQETTWHFRQRAGLFVIGWMYLRPKGSPKKVDVLRRQSIQDPSATYRKTAPGPQGHAGPRSCKPTVTAAISWPTGVGTRA